MDPEVEKIRNEARDRAKNNHRDDHGLHLEAGAIERMARALEQHANELERIAESLSSVGFSNCLGEGASEAEAVTANIKTAIHYHEGSVVQTYKHQAERAKELAAALRQTDRAIGNQESDGAAHLRAAAPR